MHKAFPAELIISLHDAGQFPMGSQNYKAAQIVEESVMQDRCGDATPNLYHWKKQWLGYVAEDMIAHPEEVEAVFRDVYPPVVEDAMH